MNEVNMAIVNEHLGQIAQLGSHLGGKYFKAVAKETYTDFEQAKLAVENGNNLELILNRSPRKFEVRDFDVIAQEVRQDATGTVKVVFNPGSDTEAEAAIVAGTVGFGQTTEEAIKEALAGQSRIFANGGSLVKKLNSYNQAEVDRLTALIKILNSQKDSIISTMKANEKKVQEYEQNLIKSAVKSPVDNGSPVSIVVEKA